MPNLSERGGGRVASVCQPVSLPVLYCMLVLMLLAAIQSDGTIRHSDARTPSRLHHALSTSGQ